MVVEPHNQHDRTAAAILDAAAHLLAEHGSQASMAEVATAAGVARATLYRYYASRNELLSALSARAVEDAGQLLAAAGLDHVSFDEGLVRIARAIVSVGDRYAVLIRERVPADRQAVERVLRAPVRRVFERARGDGALRADVELDLLVELFLGSLVHAMRLASSEGAEDAAATIAAVFLEGARAPA
jgi:TetR/AcrR family transcriptional repressor of mexCD-oprJ operon